MQCGERADDAEHGGERIANADAHAHRRAIRVAGEIAHAAHGFAHGTKSGAILVGPGLAKTRQAHHDELRVDGAKRFVAQAPLFHGSGTEIFHHNIGVLN